MKKKLIITCMAAVFLVSSCNKYLDVLPKTQIPEEALFDSEQGFKDALAGVYINAKNENAYGRHLSYGAIESIISSWDISSGTTEQQIGLFNYQDDRVLALFNGIFSQQYRTIAHINQILENLESRRAVLKTKNMYELIKAECLAMRACVHFDLIRLYGPMPLEPSKGNQLAYVTTFGKGLNEHISYDQFKLRIFQDLQDAEALLKPFDPIIKYSLTELRRPNSGDFFPDDTYFAYRPLRMNYYAVKALEARAHLWYGEKDLAFASASEVIEAKDSNGTPKFKLGTGADFTAKNFVLTGEQIFGLYENNMNKSYTDYFGSGMYRKGTTTTTISRDLYGNTGTDMREASLWNLITLTNGAKYYVISKYQPLELNATSTDNDYKQIPILRVSEMYLIAAEAAPFAQGVEYFKQFRAARNISQLAVPQNELELNIQILREYRKEFYAEGQAFFAFKRTNAPKSQILFVPTAATVNYLPPMPTVEITNQ
ncbi:RagB/SusD family nutrient uptake outer membrane protein [Sphingobacterium spiritivorum]|uniref:RagB/SusD family nutrient uptake outer membrane protein n=1 Tax=Sphingobacterium spiritivorum TaxID=258 RepID=UPI00191B2854|nr:RagB/SusD family nutrient uptake outer membrane protein [Sphingobacterium spiritivorum]QQT24652.1 RagB/SusD family nutrient uptake outer membrane protein [Sphingobacterium spiritivorum]